MAQVLTHYLEALGKAEGGYSLRYGSEPLHGRREVRGLQEIKSKFAESHWLDDNMFVLHLVNHVLRGWND